MSARCRTAENAERDEGDSMILSRRLQAAAGLVTPCRCLADIGTDHAYVPLYLTGNQIVQHAIAMDVAEGPLSRARADIEREGLGTCVEIRLSDGLSRLKAGEADCILIAGMGGALTIRILENGRDLLSGAGPLELVLQPQSEIPSARRYLQEHGWRIDREDMVLEDGKYYSMMQAHRREEGETGALSDLEAAYGPCLLGEGHQTLVSFLEWERGILQRNLNRLPESDSDRIRTRRGELIQKLDQNRAAAEICRQAEARSADCGQAQAGPEGCGLAEAGVADCRQARARSAGCGHRPGQTGEDGL